MADYSAMIRSTFEMGSIMDAQNLFFACVKSAFPTNDFRRLELIRFVKEDQYMEGRSWNHVFEMRAAEFNGHKVWDVRCRRVSSGTSPEKHVYVDYLTLGFLCYAL